MKDDPPDLSTRPGRALAIRKELGLTTSVFAERLNDAAEAIGLDRYWTANKLTLIETNRRDLSSEDAVVFGHLDPQRRGWTWVMWGVPMAKGEDAWTVLNKAAKKAKRDASDPPTAPLQTFTRATAKGGAGRKSG